MTIPDEFLEWLRDELNESNLSQSEASRRAGLNPNAISDIVNRKVKEVSLKTCKALARQFNTPVEKVMRLAGHLDPPPEEGMTLKELVEAAKLLSAEDRAYLLKIARSLPPDSQHADESH
jgi:transcriptional regulator with XRE-family HTH domain